MTTVFAGTTSTAADGAAGRQRGGNLFSRWPQAQPVPPGGIQPLAGPKSVTVIHPTTRKPMTVMYNGKTQLYLDAKTKAWKPAPTWMRSQIR